MHHTLADGGKGNFYRAFAEVTAAQAQLTPQNAADEIDRLIVTAWQHKLPVYLELPSDIAYLEIDVPEQALQLTMPTSDAERLRACTQAILARLQAAKSPALLLDLDADRFGVREQLAALADALADARGHHEHLQRDLRGNVAALCGDLCGGGQHARGPHDGGAK